jgi:hypothetical protein
MDNAGNSLGVRNATKAGGLRYVGKASLYEKAINCQVPCGNSTWRVPTRPPQLGWLWAGSSAAA